MSSIALHFSDLTKIMYSDLQYNMRAIHRFLLYERRDPDKEICLDSSCSKADNQTQIATAENHVLFYYNLYIV